MGTAVTDLKSEHDRLMALLLEKEPSLAIGIGAVMTKSLLLAGASEMEAEVQRILIEYYAEITKKSFAVEFVTNKAIKRQFHTYFQWESPNANQFWGLFGNDFKTAILARLKVDDSLSAAIKDFMALGSLRNQLVHQNFAAFPLEKTADEVFSLYSGASKLCAELPALLRTLLPDDEEVEKS